MNLKPLSFLPSHVVRGTLPTAVKKCPHSYAVSVGQAVVEYGTALPFVHTYLWVLYRYLLTLLSCRILLYSDELVKFIIEKYSYCLSLALIWSQVADK